MLIEKYRFIVSFIIIFGTFSFPISYAIDMDACRPHGAKICGHGPAVVEKLFYRKAVKCRMLIRRLVTFVSPHRYRYTYDI